MDELQVTVIMFRINFFLKHLQMDVRYFVPSPVIISIYLICSMIFMCHEVGLNSLKTEDG